MSWGSGGRFLAGAGLVLLGTALFGAYTIVLRPLADGYGGAVPAVAASTVLGAVPYLLFAGTPSWARGCRRPRWPAGC